MNRILFMVMCCFSVSAVGQEMALSGTVKSDGEALPFATIGMLNKNIGTIADEYGAFELTIPNTYREDTLVISYLGYKSKSFVPSLLSQHYGWEINLEKDVIQLRPVVVVDKRAKKLRLGGRKEKSTYVWVSAQGKGAEVATLMQPGDPIFLTKVGVQILNRERKPFKLLLNLYERDPDTELPGKSLLQHEVLIESAQESGWLEVEVFSESIVIAKPFYVAFKWVDVEERRPQLAINDKVTSQTRYVALGKWIELFNWNIRAEGVRIRAK